MVATEIKLDGIGHVLADNELRVPVYQRSFAWTKEEVGDLLSDLWESFRSSAKEYFLGSVVLSGPQGTPPWVVDGQQRLACVSMIYSVIRDVLHEASDKRTVPLANKFLFTLNFKTEETEPHLRLNEADDDFFRKRVLADPGDAARTTAPSADSHKRIQAAFDQIRKFVVERSGKEIAVLIEWADFLEKNAKVIVVSVPDEANAFLIFETLNDRGLDLSIADLLKNYIFGRSENRLNEVRANWLKATSALEGAGGDRLVATFIRHFWSSKQGPVRERGLYADLKRNIKTKQAAVDFSVELAENARLYAAILNSDHDVWQALGSDAAQHVQSLINLRLEQYRPLLLACLTKFTPAELRKAVRLLVSWNVRLLVVGGLGGGTMEKHYANGGKSVREGSITTASGLAKFGATFVPADAQFEGSFATATVSQAFLARYYLQALEQSLQGEKNPELVPNTLEKEVTLEHVLPQSPKEGEWPNFSDEAVKANCKRIGNLTLLKSDENNKGGNKAFAKKYEAYKKSKLHLNKSIASCADWDENSIAERQQMLASSAVKTWPLKP